MANKDIDLTVAIHAGSASGEVLWSKAETVKTSKTGLCTVTLDFSDIDWKRDELFITVSADGIDLGANQIKSVPYAITASRLEGTITEDELIGTWYCTFDDMTYTFAKNKTFTYEYDETTKTVGHWKLLNNGAIICDYSGITIAIRSLYDRETKVLYLDVEGPMFGFKKR